MTQKWIQQNLSPLNFMTQSEAHKTSCIYNDGHRRGPWDKAGLDSSCTRSRAWLGVDWWQWVCDRWQWHHVGFDAWDGVIHQCTDLPAVGPMPQLERKFRSRAADCTYNAPHMHLICSAYQAHKRRITRAIRYPTQVSHILSVTAPSSYKGEPRHRFMDKSIGYMGHIFRMWGNDVPYPDPLSALRKKGGVPRDDWWLMTETQPRPQLSAGAPPQSWGFPMLVPWWSLPSWLKHYQWMFRFKVYIIYLGLDASISV